MAGVAAAAETSPRPAETRKGDILYRKFGRTAETVSVIGVGCSHIGRTSSDDLAIRIVRTAIDRGVNFMDNSWDYNGASFSQSLHGGATQGFPRCWPVMELFRYTKPNLAHVEPAADF